MANCKELIDEYEKRNEEHSDTTKNDEFVFQFHQENSKALPEKNKFKRKKNHENCRKTVDTMNESIIKYRQSIYF